MQIESEDALSHHGAGHFHEAGDVGALDVVDVAIGLLAVELALTMDSFHDFAQTGVDFFGSPGKFLGILGHFET